MAIDIGTAYLQVVPSFKGFRNAVEQGFSGAGTQAAEQFTRDANGRLRDLRGRFVREGEQIGQQMGQGMSAPMQRSGGQSGDSFLGGLKGKAMAGIAGVAVAVGAAFMDAYGEALQVRNAKVMTQAQLGISPQDSERLGKIAGDLYRQNYGESISGLTGDVATVFSSLKGLGSDKEIERATAKALSFGQAFEVDVTDAVQSVSTLVGSGLVKDSTEAFDLLTAASQKVPAALRGDIMDASDEYGQFFRTLGFSGDEAFGALVKGADKGTFGIDKTGDAIKEFTLLSTDMSDNTVAAYESIGLNATDMTNAILAGGDQAKGAFDQITSGILGIQDPAAQSQAALALFGTPLEDMNVQDIPQFLEGLKGMSGGLGETAGAADKMDATLGSTASGLDTLWRNIKATLVDTITNFVLPAINAAVTWLGEKLLPIVQSLAAWLGENLGPILQKVADFFVLVLVPAIQQAWQWFEVNLLPTVQRVGQFFADTFGNILAVLGGFIDFLIGVFTGNWSKAWDGIKQIFGAIWDQIKNIVSLVWGTIQGVLTAGWNWIKTNVLDPMGAGLTILGNFFSGLWLKVQEVWTFIQTKITDAWNWIRDFIFSPLKSGISEVGLFFSNLWGTVQNVWTWISNKITEVWNWINQKVFAPMVLGINTIMTWMSNLWTTVEGIWNKITGFFGDVAKGIQDAVNTVKQAIKDISDEIQRFLTERIRNWGGTDTGGVLGNIQLGPGGARGMVVPGRDPGRRDNMLMPVRSEEAIMVPEFTHAVGGPAGVYALNRAAETGRFWDAFGPGMARGGVVGQAAHDTIVEPVKALLGKIKDSFIAGFASAVPAGARGAFLNAILSKQGTRYVWGAAGPDVFDCSGLMSWGLEQAGVGKGRLTAEGFNSGFPATSNPQPGDMITFDTGRIPGKAGHIGAVLNPGAQTMMHTDGAGPARIQGYAGRSGFLRFVDVIGGGPATYAPGGPNGATGDPAANVNGSGVERWRGLALQALSAVGAYKGMNLIGNIDRMMNQIRTESGGNPFARNDWDSNALRGDPSIGLLQVIGETFRNALRNTPFEYLIGRGQTDPMASMIASTLYSLNRYGSLAAAWRGVAYDNGGVWEPGTFGVNMLNKPEAVLTPSEKHAYEVHARALEDGYAGRAPAYQFTGDIHVTDPAEFFRETAWQARKARV